MKHQLPSEPLPCPFCNTSCLRAQTAWFGLGFEQAALTQWNQRDTHEVDALKDALAVSRVYVGMIVEDGAYPEQQRILASEHINLIDEIVP